jgi:hypothetical protein
MYLPSAKSFVGTYVGSFDGIPGELKISFEGDKPVVDFDSDNGSRQIVARDASGTECDSSIGQLLNFRGTDGNTLVAKFAFDSNHCRVSSNRPATLDLTFKKSKRGGTQLEASLVEIIAIDPTCANEDIACSAINQYMSGSFTKR